MCISLCYLLLLLGGSPDGAISTSSDQVVTSIAFWNLENLFDYEDDPENPGDDEFLPDKEWDQDRYSRKLAHLARAVDSLDTNLLAVCEVENRRVLEDLVSQAALEPDGWSIVHIDSPDHRGIDLALLYRAPFQLGGPAELHPIDMGGGNIATRGILEVPMKVAGAPIVVVVNHWPSRYGGATESAPKRAAAASTARKIIDRHLEQNPLADIVIVGDLNDDPWDASVLRVLKAVREQRTVEHPYNLSPAQDGKLSPRLWNPSWAFASGSDIGTYYYWNDWTWNCFDQIIVSPGMLDSDGISLVKGSVAVHHPEFMTDSVKNASRPARFRKFRGNWEEGYSDHFPVKAKIQIESPNPPGTTTTPGDRKKGEE
ncbi:MAG: endonuclease/exonuclease/phosphatase family protein [Planctomycetes bacterium]|nr:endonuclease/exonuclease/phosphatase family protein [Planctomycetota bacterium]